MYSRSAFHKNHRGLRDHQRLILALWLAQDEKLFAKNGIDADLVFMPGSPTLIAAINSGAIAVGFTAGTAILATAASGADFKVLAASHVRANHDLVVKPEIKRAEDLRGKRIGVTSIGGTGLDGRNVGIRAARLESG